MHPMAKIVEGRVTLETPGGHPFTFETLRDVHTRAMMAGIPTDATIVRIAWHMRPATTDPQQVSVYYVVQEHQLLPRTPEQDTSAPFPQAAPTGHHPFPNPITTQE